MDPLTITAGVELANLVLTTIQRYTSGDITTEQANAAFAAASDHLTSAVAAFEAAGKSSG